MINTYEIKRKLEFFKFNIIRFFNKGYERGYDDIKEIQLILENVDVITIPRKYIGNFYISSIQKSICRMGCNYIGESIVADKFILEVNEKANTHENSPNYGERYIFERLIKYNDICSIDIIYKTGKVDSYSFDYDGDDENANQKSRINKFGDLELVIGKELKLEDYFYFDQTQHERAFRWEMYEIE